MGLFKNVKEALGFGSAACYKEDCKKVENLVQVIIDDEATEEEKKFFEDHICQCTCCKKIYNCEKDVLNCVKEKLARKCCPQSLKDSIKAKLQ